MTQGATDTRGLLLPDGARLLHIGPHKTGTTSLQAALFAARPAMLEQGVRHVGTSRNPASAVRSVTGQPGLIAADTPLSIKHWTDLVEEFRRAPEARVILSSEFFSWALPQHVERIATDLDRDRIHIVVTLRPIGRILPSQWQQNVQAGMVHAYDVWLDAVLRGATGRLHDQFWALHQHDALIERWAAVFGRERVTAVVVDEQDHGMLLRTFEGFLGLRDGTLQPARELANRSMTAPEVEAVRAFNEAARDAGVRGTVLARTMRFGSAAHMKQRVPPAHEARIDTPQWALDLARERGVAIVAGVERAGTRVVGDLQALVQPEVSRSGGMPADVAVTPEIAGRMALGVLMASGAAGTAVGDNTWIEPQELAQYRTRQLTGVVARRIRTAVGKRARALVGRSPKA